MKKWFKLGLLFGVALVTLAGCKQTSAEKVIKIGVVGSDTEVWDHVQENLKKDGIKLEYVIFTDYNQPNNALVDGSIDLNAFQHQFFLDNFNEANGTDIVSIGNTVNAPLGIYSDKLKDIKSLKKGARVAIPNDVTNGGRALILLETAGFIEVDNKAGLTPSVDDITQNTYQLVIEELDAAQTARSLQDVDIAVINSGVAVDSGFLPSKDAIFLEPVDEKSKPYVNIIAARKADAKNLDYQKVVDAYQTDDTKKVILETSKGSSIPSWEQFGRN